MTLSRIGTFREQDHSQGRAGAQAHDRHTVALAPLSGKLTTFTIRVQPFQERSMSEVSGTPPPAPRGADFGVVDVKAMPGVVRRIVAAAIAEAPGRVALAVAASLGAAV